MEARPPSFHFDLTSESSNKENARENTPELATVAPVAIKSTIRRRFQNFKRHSQVPLEIKAQGTTRQSTGGHSILSWLPFLLHST